MPSFGHAQSNPEDRDNVNPPAGLSAIYAPTNTDYRQLLAAMSAIPAADSRGPRGEIHSRTTSPLLLIFPLSHVPRDIKPLLLSAKLKALSGLIPSLNR